MGSVNVPSVPRDALLTTCVVAGVDMDVIFTHEAPDYIGALVHGHRGMVEIYAVIHSDADLILVLNEETIGDIERQLLEQHEENNEDRDYY
jgi:hypothetical protein